MEFETAIVTRDRLKKRIDGLTCLKELSVGDYQRTPIAAMSDLKTIPARWLVLDIGHAFVDMRKAEKTHGIGSPEWKACYRRWADRLTECKRRYKQSVKAK